VAPRHVLDQVFHPKQRVTPISHEGVPSLASIDRAEINRVLAPYRSFEPARPCESSGGFES
jgi:hypothetical protein